jgi:hypothetical protein
MFKNDTNFWDDFFIIPILRLKKTTNKKSNQLYIKKIQIFGITVSLFLFYPYKKKLSTKKVTLFLTNGYITKPITKKIFL